MPTNYETADTQLEWTPVVLPQQPEPATDVVDIWGLPLARMTYGQTLDLIDRRIAVGGGGFFITANLHYARLTAKDGRLADVNRQADFLVADGMPMVWYSRLIRDPLPQRVTGADLIILLSDRAAQRGHRLFLLGGAPGVANEAAEVLRAKYPGLDVVGTACPEMDRMSKREHDALIEEIRRARPDLLFAALGQPKGELWLAENRQRLGVPVGVQLGASFDFVVGRVTRAPRWVQRIGAEWLYRITRQPRRMIPRYWGDGIFLLRAVAGDLLHRCFVRAGEKTTYPNSQNPKHEIRNK